MEPAAQGGAAAAEPSQDWGKGPWQSGSIPGTFWRLGQRIQVEDLVAAAAAAAAQPPPPLRRQQQQQQPRPVSKPPLPPAAGRPSGGSRRPASEAVRKTVSLADLTAAGVIVPGKGSVSCAYKGMTYTADLAADGSIEFEGRRYTSATAFSLYCKRLITPNKHSDDGWKSVSYNGLPMEHYRKVYLEQQAGEGGLQQRAAGQLGVAAGLQAPLQRQQQQQQQAGPQPQQQQQGWQQVQQDAAAPPGLPEAAAAAAAAGARATPRAGRGSGGAHSRRKRRRKAPGDSSEEEEEQQEEEEMDLEGPDWQEEGPAAAAMLQSPLTIDGQIVVELPPDAEVENPDRWVQCERCEVWRLVPSKFWQAVQDDPREEWFCEYAQWDVASQPSQPSNKPACKKPSGSGRGSGGSRRKPPK